ncbi:MAG: phosphotransferase [Leptospirales bacterium]|nr:phosphotransferase [Leptospirales bacterium]
MLSFPFHLPQSFIEVIEEKIGKDPVVHKLAGDASVRQYFRLLPRSGEGSLIICVDPANSVQSFIEIHRLFKDNGIEVPDVFVSDPEIGLLLLEDLGDINLETLVKDCLSDETVAEYKKVIKLVLDIQSIRGVTLERSFDVQKLMSEFEFFIEHCLKGYFKISDIPPDLKEGFEEIARAMYEPKLFVIAHRDYHSRNIIIKDNVARLIDFQDAMMGLPQYDIVSLLEDPYSSLLPDVKERLKEDYRNTASQRGIDTGDFERLYHIAAYQRNIKALGTYGYMASVKNNSSFIPYIDISIRNIDSYALRREETSRSWNIIKRLI